MRSRGQCLEQIPSHGTRRSEDELKPVKSCVRASEPCPRRLGRRASVSHPKFLSILGPVDWAYWRRFGRPLNWSETIMFTVDMHVTEIVVSTVRFRRPLAKPLNSLSSHLTTSLGERKTTGLPSTGAYDPAQGEVWRHDPRPQRPKRLREILLCGLDGSASLHVATISQ